jgi:hypothetical protein
LGGKLRSIDEVRQLLRRSLPNSLEPRLFP